MIQKLWKDKTVTKFLNLCRIISLRESKYPKFCKSYWHIQRDYILGVGRWLAIDTMTYTDVCTPKCGLRPKGHEYSWEIFKFSAVNLHQRKDWTHPIQHHSIKTYSPQIIPWVALYVVIVCCVFQFHLKQPISPFLYLGNISWILALIDSFQSYKNMAKLRIFRRQKHLNNIIVEDILKF